MDKSKATELLLKIGKFKPKILVLGDVMLDNYVYGEVKRISPEAPVPVLDYIKDSHVLGGAGNVAHNLVNLGVEVYLSTILGNDVEGDLILNLLKKIDVSVKSVYQAENVKTTKKTRFLSGGVQLLRLDADTSVFKSNFKKFELLLNTLKVNFDAIIISDYDKGVCSSMLIQRVIEKAIKLKIPVLVDPKGESWSKYSFASCITPNINEVTKELKMDLKSDFDFLHAAKKIKEKYNLQSCLITRGADGMTYLGENNKIHQKVEKKEVFDVSGAGDSVISSFAAALCSGISIKESLLLSAFVSSEVVSHLGTTPFNVNMLKYE